MEKARFVTGYTPIRAKPWVEKPESTKRFPNPRGEGVV